MGRRESTGRGPRSVQQQGNNGTARAATPKPKATDVAARAGVSIATVSLVANGKAAGRVSDATRERVEQAIADLGYVVNPSARSLVTGRHDCVALLAHDMTNPFISTLAAGVADALGTDTRLMLAVAGPERADSELERIASFGVDGILMDFPVGKQRSEFAPDMPIVFLDDPAAPPQLPRVYFDSSTAARDLAAHLVDLGHRRIVYVDSIRPFPTFTRRRRYFTDEFSRRARPGQITRVRSDISLDAARDLVRGSWTNWQRDRVTAVVTAADVQAFGVVAALNELGLGVPRDVSVASFDNIAMAEVVTPPLTTVELPAFDLGFQAATLLMNLIERGPAAARTVVLPCQLVVRNSTGPSPARRRTAQ